MKKTGITLGYKCHPCTPYKCSFWQKGKWTSKLLSFHCKRGISHFPSKFSFKKNNNNSKFNKIKVLPIKESKLFPESLRKMHAFSYIYSRLAWIQYARMTRNGEKKRDYVCSTDALQFFSWTGATFLNSYFLNLILFGNQAHFKSAYL
jgi:hypothetical protein